MKRKVIFGLFLIVSVTILLFSVRIKILLPIYVIFCIGLVWYSFFKNIPAPKNESVDIDKPRAEIIKKTEDSSLVADESDIRTKMNEILQLPDSIQTIPEAGERLLMNLSKITGIVQGLFYRKLQQDEIFTVCSKYAFISEKEPDDFSSGEGIHGQVAKNKKKHILADISEKYIVSGLGKGSPVSVVILPVFGPDESVIGVFEIAFFKKIDMYMENLLDEFCVQAGTVIYNKN